MRFRLLIGLVGVCGALALASDIIAQPLESTTPPVKRESPPPAIPDRDIRPTPPPVPHAPGFLTPLTRSTKNGRVGIAGWTATRQRSSSRLFGIYRRWA